MGEKMVEKGRVTVVVTCYNYGCFLAGCLESILGQTYRNFEIILVNDGSTDNSEAVAAPFLSDPRITYIRQENRGQAVAKNTGLAAAMGEFVAFLDADDRWKADKLAKQMLLFEDQRVGVVFSLADLIDAEGIQIGPSSPGKYLQPRSGKVTNFLFMDNFVPFSSSLVRRECFKRAGNFDESLPMGIDWDLWLRISLHYQFVFVDEPLLLYRIGHPGQMSKKMEIRQSCSDRIMAKFIDENPGSVSKRTIRRAFAYSSLNRAYYFREIDLGKSFYFYLRAIILLHLLFPHTRGYASYCSLECFKKSIKCRIEPKSHI